MQLIVVSGMLGVGKTSVLLGMLKILQGRGKKVAVIENDIGTVSVDSAIISKDGMEVLDLQNGCICCTLKMDLLEGLIKIRDIYCPDYVILEPTGIANPSDLLEVINSYENLKLDKISSFSVIDAERFHIMKKVYARPIKNHLSSADCVLINKVDAVSEEKIPEIKSGLSELGFSGKIFLVQADIGKGLEDAMNAVIRWCTTKS